MKVNSFDGQGPLSKVGAHQDQKGAGIHSKRLLMAVASHLRGKLKLLPDISIGGLTPKRSRDCMRNLHTCLEKNKNWKRSVATGQEHRGSSHLRRGSVSVRRAGALCGAGLGVELSVQVFAENRGLGN